MAGVGAYREVGACVLRSSGSPWGQAWGFAHEALVNDLWH